MHSLKKISSNAEDINCHSVEPSRTVTSLSTDVCTDLLESPRSLPPKYFYDERGSLLFDRICTTPEYYPTRKEDKLLQQYAEQIISSTLPEHIIELGSGTSRKTRRLFDACANLEHHCSYAPFDVCEPMLKQAASELSLDYDWLEIDPLVGDYHAGLENLPRAEATNLFIFLGSTIGNFSPDEATDFLQDLRNCMSKGDFFLVGADRFKDTDVLNAAYNDAQGLTAEFNLNVLNVINRELGSNFDIEKFRHQANFNSELSRIEMRLIALEEQDVNFDLLKRTAHLKKGESILTEISRKFKANEIETMLINHSFEVVEHFQMEDEYFSLLLVSAI